MANPTARDDHVVVVTGDIVMDHNLAITPRGKGSGQHGEESGTARLSVEPGGAALLAALVSAAATDLAGRGGPPITVRSVGSPREALSTGDDFYHQSFGLWSQFKRRDGGAAWRIDRPLGHAKGPFTTAAPDWAAVADDPERADLVVLDDANFGFRDRPELWPRAISEVQGAPWVLLKMARPVAAGALWDRLIATRADRMIALIRIDDLRLTQAQISRDLSWERTAQDLMWELAFNREVNALSRCAHLIVSFSTAGALHLTAADDAGSSRARLYFDPRVMEDGWVEEHPGGMYGYAACLTAGVARELMSTPDAPDIGRGITRGLGAARDLHLNGYSTGGEEDYPLLRFPLERIVARLAVDDSSFADSPVRDPTLHTGTASPAEELPLWTILEEKYTDGLEQVARRIALNGPGDVVANVPVGQFGKLLTIDRQEIEGYRSVRSLIQQYAGQERPERPLSIAVFGRPGSGKSFGIKQMAVSMLPDLIDTLTVNLSQFEAPDQLHDAFHQVRDRSLKGKLPLVFWDEFDATLGDEPLGWLRHFLAPMQDGEFQEGQSTHHIGRAIFVFAGGTRQRMRDFSSDNTKEFRDAKGRDFVSRLKGYVDIIGPNKLEGRSDPHHVTRRAILLRSLLLPHKNLFRGDELHIDSGVLRAFLRTRAYEHGARSMESIIAMSLLDGKSRFERSCLPSEEQMALHVDPQDFLDLVRSLVIEGALLEELAEAVHISYCASELAKGASWAEPDLGYLARHKELTQFAERSHDPSTAPASLVAFGRLPADAQEQNRDLARDIPNKLEAAGYRMYQARGGGPVGGFPEEVVELLAEQEHDRWVRLKLKQGWCYAPVTDRDAGKHADIIPWRSMNEEERVKRYGPEGTGCVGSGVLGEEERQKDRDLMVGLTSILAQHGYRVEKIDEAPSP
jgi:hypothetical protein